VPGLFRAAASLKFLLKISRGEIKLPLVRMEASRKGMKGVYLQYLADYLDRRRDLVVKEAR